MTIPAEQLEQLPGRPDLARSADNHVTATFSVGDADGAAGLVARLTSSCVDVADLEITSPSLDDVFAHLTFTGANS